MLAFRKFFLSLAAVAALATTASAQNPLNCIANSGVPPLLRAEGLAELVGDVLIECTGGNASETRLVNIDIFLNTNITSDLISGNTSEGLVLLDEPAPGTQVVNGNVFQGVRTAGFENRLTWNGIPFVPPGSTGARRLRITNVRANATQLPTGQFVPSSVSMFINVSPQNSLPLQNPQQVVGTILPSLAVTVSPASFKKCEPPSGTFTVSVTELFATAFKKRIETDTDFFGAPIYQNRPGFIYGTESGFTPDFTSVASLGGIGVADTGTRFVINFASVPTGVTINAPNWVNSTANANYRVSRVTGWNADFSGGSLATSAGSSSVPLTSGAGTVVYEVIGAPTVTDTSVFDTFPIGFTASFTSTVGLGDASVTASYGPVNETATMSSTAPEPRFTNRDATPRNIFSIKACRTLLLFPFVTNQAGFDTGLAISNTSTDPFGTAPQTGPCTMYYYGNTNGTGAAPAAQTSAAVPSGDHLVATLSSGGKFGVKETPGFQGYIIAVCNFQYAHGYAFISDLGSQKLAQGYLALIIPDKAGPSAGTGRAAEAFSLNQGTQQGEQLVH